MKKYDKKYKVYLSILLTFAAVISASSFFFFQSDFFALKAKNYLSSYLSSAIKKQVTIKKIKFSVFSPQIKLYGLSIKNFAKINRINISLGQFNIFQRKIIIYKVNIINPDIFILIKNNKINNYKNIGYVIKSLTEKHTVSFISVSLEKLKLTGGNFNLDDADKNILLTDKKFDFTAYKKLSPFPFLYQTGGMYFKYEMPHIFLKYGKLKFKESFNSSAVEIHYFKSFVKYHKINFGNKYFSSVSQGIFELNKKKQAPEIIKKINNTTILKVYRLSYLSKKFPLLPLLKGKLKARLTFVGDFSKKITAGALIRLKNIIFAGGDIKSGTINCSGNLWKAENSVIDFKSIDLQVFGGTLKSAGSINLNEKEGKFKSSLKNIDIGKLIDFYDTEKIPQFKASASGKVTTFIYLGKNFYIANIENIEIKKPVQQIKFKNSKGGSNVYSINYKNKASIKGATLINDKYVLLKNVRIVSRTVNGSLKGEINYGKRYLSINFRSLYKKLPSISIINKYRSRYFDPSGTGELKGIAKGGFGNISFNLSNAFKELDINRYLSSYKGNADVDIMPDGKVFFKKVYLVEKNRGFNKKGALFFGGEIFEDKISKKEHIKVNFSAKNIHLVSKKPSAPISVSFNSNGTISGDIRNPFFKITAYSKKDKIYGQNISSVNLSFLLNKSKLKIEKLEGIFGGSLFRCYGSLNFAAPVSGNSGTIDNNYKLRLVSNRFNLSDLNFKLLNKYRVKGFADIGLNIGGSFNLPNISGKVFINGIYINNYPFENISLSVYSSKSRVKLKLSALRDALKAKAAVLLKKGYPYNFTANINQLKINYRKTLFELTGGIFGNGRLSDIKNSYIFSKLNYVYLKHGPFFLKNPKNINISYIKGTLNLSGFNLAGGNNFFQIRGNITPSKYHIIVNDRTDMWLLGIFSDRISNSSGFITSSAVIFGPFADPKIYGFADIERGLIEPSGYPSFTVSRIFAKLIFNNNMIFLQKARFRMLNGIFSARGVARLKNFKPYYYNIETDFNSAIYRKSNYFYAKINGKIGYSGYTDNPVLYGNINIKKALYDKKVNFSSFLLSYKKYNAVHPIIKSGVLNPKLNIRIKSDKGIAIENNIINTRFSANLRLMGTVYDPILTGTADAERGGIFFRGTKFKLSYANLDFNDRYGINPSFDVAAATHINSYIIRMNANGSLLNFNVNLSSSPPLSELDIVSMLALGAPSSSVYAGSAGGIAASEAASAIGGGVEQNVTGAISSYFGFKNLSVAPSYSVITHSAAPQVTVTKTITKKLSVSYSNIISSQSSQSVTLTYSLSRHISVIGVWENNELAPNNSNVYSEVGGNIVFHFRFY
jgi:hypothetical protein